MLFEGSEKKLEISLKNGTKSLRAQPRAFWEHLVKIADAQILSHASRPLCDSYLLSESSLFVFPQKFILITCGRSQLVPVAKEFLQHFPLGEIDTLFYERKNEFYPTVEQGTQQSHFYQDAETLAQLMPGQAVRFGDEAGQHVMVFALARAAEKAKATDKTLEVLMYDLHPDMRKIFGRDSLLARKWIAENPAFQAFFESYDILDHAFEPHGYSINAIKGDRYFTFHVAVDERGAFASFECNAVEKEVDAIVSAVRGLFRPRSYQILTFSSSQPFLFSELGQLSARHKGEKTLHNGFVLQYMSVVERANHDAVDDLALPAYQGPAIQESPLTGWLYEKNEKSILGAKLKSKLYSEKSAQQTIEICDTEVWDKTLVCDGRIVSTESDEFIAHEMMAHVPLFVHPSPARVLIIGGGDLGTAREVLKHDSVTQCVCIENDEKVVEACRKHFAWPEAVLADARFELKIGDAVSFVQEYTEQFDIVLIDSSEGVGPDEKLFSETLYRHIENLLAPGALVVSQALSPFFKATEQKKLQDSLKKVFSKVFFYNYSNLSSQGGLRTFAFSSDTFNPLEDFDREKARRSKIDFRYYNPEIHFASFFLPSFMRKNLNRGNENLAGETQSIVPSSLPDVFASQ